jgi:glycosyltransferase involved in cell wall biosynthesis
MPTTIHLIAPHHTVLNDEHSHCAFTGKARRFAKMMHLVGRGVFGGPFVHKYNIIEYANEGSMSEADEKVVMLNAAEYKKFYKHETNSPGAQSNVDLPGAQLFRQRLEAALADRAKVGDICGHIWAAHSPMVQRFPGLIHIETGIGYPQGSFGAYRIFESEAWRHYQWGRIGSHGGVMPGCEVHPQGIDTNTARTWVVPNYFDLDDWPVVSERPAAESDYVVFMSRFVVDKGIVMLARVIKAWCKKHPESVLRFKLAGMGGYAQWLVDSDFTPAELGRIDYVGVVNGRDRAKLIGGARAMLLPTIFVEPFGGAAVEAMLCGTPAITSDFGAFTETVWPETGFRCRTVDDYVAAIEGAAHMHRGEVAELTRNRYSLEACAEKYDKIFEELVTHPYAS